MAHRDRSGRWRVAVLLAVVALHFVVGFGLLALSTVRFARLSADAPLSLLALSRTDRARPPVMPETPNPSRPSARRESAPEIARPPDAAAPEPNNAITLPLDLSADANEAASQQATQEQNEKRRRNLAGPSDSQLEWSRNNVPLIRDFHQPGDNESAPGGELITWVSDKCYFTTHGITTFGVPQTRKVCKDPPKPETELFKDMRKKLDQSAEGRAP